MWGLWFFPLVVLLFIVGVAVGLVWYFTGRKDGPARIVVAAAFPFGCAAMPIIGLTLLAAASSALQTSDVQLYEEVFGYRPTITEDRMLFDDFGSGRDREIFMHAEPNDAEHKKLMAIPGLVESEYTLDLFIARGAQHGFGWWMEADSVDFGYCKSARILDAPGFHGWREFRVAECLDAGNEFPASTNVHNVYVVAYGRMDD